MTASSKPALPFFDPSLFNFPGLSLGGSEGGALKTPLDFPLYFFNLMQTTLDAIVNSAIAQMEAYSELMLQATMSAEHFAQALGAGASDLPAMQQAAALVEAEPTPAGIAKGINPIVVTDGKPKTAPRTRKPRSTTAGKTVRAKAAPKAAAKP